ncbi:cupredoxin domain-containing protein [Acidovorax soli]|uniref:Uncharacterized copper-binding protein, cupredoxin-like subfamily n=1 Tax=Acidovorax soli TaxID=592050 RepID=A0A1H4CAE1_9BURK|nr:cupredoxin family protein [Acidovorax soli]SEA57336.1 Uncharacterized copper-binding protein, cupredoxin-like subfamily [Acidovorax soli]
MKFTWSHAFRFFAMVAFAASGAAFASGSHTGGHGHDGDETAIGKPGLTAKVRRTITIEMSDNMRYTPSNIQVKQGETVRLIVKNVGQAKHELSLGTEKELLEHLEQMKKFPDMEHDEPSKVTLQPGKRGEIVWQFTKAGTVNFACLMPGHYEAGMKGVVRVGSK